jgi:uncharacterized protein (TIGR02421 family)
VAGSDDEKIEGAARVLREAEGYVRVLRTIAWPKEAADQFFDRGADHNPDIEYEPLDPAPVIERVASVRTSLDAEDPTHAWLLRQADSIETGARMLAAVGTRDFYTHSVTLYGRPQDPILDGETTSLALAKRLDGILAALDHDDLGAQPQAITAQAMLARMRRLIRPRFGDATPELELVDGLGAKAVAGPRRVRFRADAMFTEQDLRQLLFHEIYVHVATSLNGRAQTRLPILAGGHPGTTRTQEGLAVFSELVGGAMAPSRFRRLADRVLAIQMAIEGASFIELYRFFLERTNDPSQSFDNARRIVRGGLMDGGAPFTKDGVYLDGLLRVHNFLRTAVMLDRVDLVAVLFCGKLDLEDVPALLHLAHEGLCAAPRYLPPWAEDRQFLVSYLAYSGFLNEVNLSAVKAHYAKMLAGTPNAFPSASGTHPVTLANDVSSDD